MEMQNKLEQETIAEILIEIYQEMQSEFYAYGKSEKFYKLEMRLTILKDLCETSGFLFSLEKFSNYDNKYKGTWLY